MLEETERYQRILHENNQHITHRQSLIILSLKKYVCNILKKLILELYDVFVDIFAKNAKSIKNSIPKTKYCREQKVYSILSI